MQIQLGRKEREKQAHREEILRAAEKIFAEKGFFKATMEDVAAASEFSVGSLYKFFEGKESLYEAVIQWRISTLGARISDEIAAAGGPKQAVHRYIQVWCAICTEYPDFVRMYTQQRMNDRFIKSELWCKVVGPEHSRVMRQLVDEFQKGIKQGLFRSDIYPHDMAVALDGLCDAFLYDWLGEDKRYELSARADTISRLFFAGIVVK